MCNNYLKQNSVLACRCSYDEYIKPSSISSVSPYTTAFSRNFGIPIYGENDVFIYAKMIAIMIFFPGLF